MTWDEASELRILIVFAKFDFVMELQNLSVVFELRNWGLFMPIGSVGPRNHSFKNKRRTIHRSSTMQLTSFICIHITIIN